MTADQIQHGREWVAALRSGKYKQAKESLRVEGLGYCCLGVACDLSKLGRWDSTWYMVGTVSSSGSSLSTAVGEFYGLKTTDGRQWAILNDNGASFPEIADAIEAFYNEKEQDLLTPTSGKEMVSK